MLLYLSLGRDSGEDEVKGSKKVRRRAADDDGVTPVPEVAEDGEPVGGHMDEGSVDGGPSGRGPMGRSGSTETVTTRECGLDTQGETSGGGQSGRTAKRGKERERAPLEALLFPRTKRRKIDPLSSEEVDGCGLVQQQTTASRKKPRKRKIGQGEQL